MGNSNKPVLYSKTSLMLFSFFSCFFSGLLYIQNLREFKKSKFVLPMVLYSIFFPTILSKIVTSFGIPMYYSYVPINLLGGLILIKPFWEYQIGVTEYRNRSIVGPLIGVLLLIGLFITLIMLRLR